MATQEPAQAVGSPPSWSTVVDGAIDAAPIAGETGLEIGGGAAAEGAAVGGVCATGVGCVALGAAMIGLFLYQTHDTWMPWAKSVIGGVESAINPDGSYGNCTVTWGSGPPVVTTGPSANPASVTAVVNSGAQGGNCGTYDNRPNQINFDLSHLECMTTSSAQVSFPAGTTPGTSGGSPGMIYFLPGNSEAVFSAPRGQNTPSTTTPVGMSVSCPSGSAPIKALAQATCYGCNYNGQANSGSATAWVDFPIDDAIWTETTDVQCTPLNGGQPFTVHASEIGHPERMPVPSCRAVDPTSIPTSITSTNPWGNPEWTGTFPSGTDWETKYPDCFGPSGILCTIRVKINGQPCVSGMPGCAHWWEEAHNPDSDWQPKIDCEFGAYVVPIGNCRPLRRAYPQPTCDEAASSPTITFDSSFSDHGFTDGDSTCTDPTASPSPTTGPSTGPSSSPSPSPSTGPSGQPSEGPSENPSSSSSSSSLPTSGPNPDPCLTDPTDCTPGHGGHSCLGSGWSWNPVSWVYVPVKCALTWAFVPDDGFFTSEVNSVKNAWSGTAPAQLVSLVVGLPGMFDAPAAGGCAGPAMPLHFSLGSGGSTSSLHPLSTCDPSMAKVASIAHTALQVGVWIGGVMAGLRVLASSIGLAQTGAGGDV